VSQRQVALVTSKNTKIELECPGDTKDSEEGIIRTRRRGWLILMALWMD